MKLFQSKIEFYIIAIILSAAILLLFIFYTLSQINNKNEYLNQLENGLTITKNLLEEEKRYALSLSILLSEDKEIIDSYINRNREKSFEIINRKLSLLKRVQNSKVDVQIHNHNLTTYIRNWDITKKDIPLETFRQGLVKTYITKKPIVSIELGKRLNIKAISPIIYKKNMAGSIESIIGFEHLQEQMKQRGYELYVFLDKRYLNIATKLKNNPIYENYVLVNKNQTKYLEDLKLFNLKDYGYISNKQMIFSYFSYYDFKQNRLGYILTGIKNKDNIKLNNSFTYKQNENSKVIVK